MGHWGTLAVRLCALYRKNLEAEVICILLQDGALSYLYFSIFVVSRPISFFLARRTAGGSGARERHIHFAFPLFLACCLLSHQARKVGMTCFCVITTTLVFPKALCRFQSLGALR